MPLFKILHIEDDGLWCEVVAKAIQELDGVRYLGHVPTTTEAYHLCMLEHPDLILLDVYLADGSGLDLLRLLSKLAKAPRILLVTIACNEAVLLSVIQGSVVGFIRKDTFVRSSINDAIRRVLRGETYMPSDIQTAVQAFRREPGAFYKLLSDRELALIPYFGKGYTDVEIAQRIEISPLTVKSHRHHILSKLGLANSEKLVRWAHEKGFAVANSAALGLPNQRPGEAELQLGVDPTVVSPAAIWPISQQW